MNNFESGCKISRITKINNSFKCLEIFNCLGCHYSGAASSSHWCDCDRSLREHDCRSVNSASYQTTSDMPASGVKLGSVSLNHL